jgi:hypothetical protein
MDGTMPKPNRVANSAYKQRLVDYWQDNQEHMTDEQTEMLIRYIKTLDEIIMHNTIQKAQQMAQNQMAQGGPEGPEAGQLRAPGPAQPLQDVIQQNI